MTTQPDAAAGLEQRSRLFLRHQPMLLAFIRSLVYSPQDAEDLVQEVGVVVLTRHDVAVDAERFGAWCRGIARNLVLHYRRTHGRNRVVASDDLVQAVEKAYAEADDDSDEWERRRRAFVDCLSLVDDRSARLLTFRYADGLSSDEIGKRLKQSAAGVRMMLMRLRRSLQACLQKRLAGA